MPNFPKTERIESNVALPVLAKPIGTTQREINDAFSQAVDSPLRISATYPTADALLNFAPSQILNPNGSGRSVGAIGVTVPSLVQTSIDFQTGAIVGGPVSIVFPASTVGQFRRCAFSLDNTGTIIATFSSEAASVAALPNPGTLFSAGAIQVGWIDLECTNVAGQFKTAGSATNIIENSVGGTERIVMIAAGGGGGSGSGNAGVAQEVAIPALATDITVVFPAPLSGTNYVPIACMVNLVDANPQFQPITITGKTVNGFTAKWNAPTDSGDYRLSYIVPVVQEQVGEVAVAVAQTSVTVPLPITLSGNVYSVVAQLVNYVDGSPQFQPVTITQKTGSQFIAAWNAPTDGNDYKLAFHAAEYT